MPFVTPQRIDYRDIEQGTIVTDAGMVSATNRVGQSSSSWGNVPDMSITVDLSGPSKVWVLFRANYYHTGYRSYGAVRLVVGGTAYPPRLVRVGHTGSSHQQNLFYPLIVPSLPYGTHAIRAQYREEGGGTFNLTSRQLAIVVLTR